jgi:undecaprenyl-diphosphatase
MTWFDIIILGIIEGLTEFLPISSTGHLIISSKFLNLPDPELTQAFQVVIQLGAIGAILSIYSKKLFSNKKYIPKILTAFLPTAVIAFILKDHVEQILSNIYVVAWALILGGIVLVVSDRWQKKGNSHINLESISFVSCLSIGILQCLALVPGVSRSAATILAGRGLGLNFKDSAEFSFFLALPTLGAASAYKIYKTPEILNGQNWVFLVAGLFISFIVATVTVKWMLGFIEKYGMKYFGFYRIFLGFILLFIF